MSRRAVLRGGMLTSGLMLGAPLLAACSSASSASSASSSASKAAPAKTAALGAGTLRLPWLETVEFAGPFIADTNGYYKAAGFSSFTLTPGGPTATPVETELVAGKALFGISTPDLAASAVVKGAGLKIIGATFQKNPYAVLSLASKPISTPQDMVGKKIGVAALDESAWTAFLKANHIDPASITAVPVQTDLTPLGGERGQVFGPGFHRLDASLFKEFRTTEKTRLEFRAEFFNLTNHPNFSTPQGPTGGSAVVSAPGALDFKSVNFGRITATRDTPNDPRQIQFGLKLYW